MNNRVCPRLVLAILIFLVTAWSVSTAVAEADKLTVQPGLITISSFFSGSEMNITGNLPAGCQAVLTIRGKNIEEEMMRKSRHWDLWMNSGEVDIDNVPLLYIAFSSNPALLQIDSGDYPWGYASLEKVAKFTGRLKPVEDDTIFAEFIQLKERDKLYHLYPGGLQITNTNSGESLALASLHLPSRIKPGTYQVALWIVRNGKILEKRTTTFNVKLQGIPAILQDMAKTHGVTYGLLAVAVAMTVGMGTGIIFKGKGGGH
jgi:hypothetical protein